MLMFINKTAEKDPRDRMRERWGGVGGGVLGEIPVEEDGTAAWLSFIIRTQRVPSAVLFHN